MGEQDHLTWYIVPIIIAIAIFIFAAIVELVSRKNISIRKLLEILKSGAFLSPTFLSIITGVVLIVAASQNFLFAPGLALNDSLFSIILRIGQLVIGLSLILGIMIRLSTLGLIACFVAGFFIFPYYDMLDYTLFLGIGVFLFLVHRDALSFSFFFHPVEKHELFDHYRKYAFPVLRFIAGLTLVYAALRHNIIDYMPAVNYLEQRPLLNFMQSLFGFDWYSNFWFVIHTGIFSVLLGSLIAFGFLERLTSTIIGIGLIMAIFIGGVNFLPIILPYFAIIYIIITGNQFEERETFVKA